jgi:CheY-like chemotaxis protein/predicted regulator of Ras-like GTPase activity (Roadblock/LC7/MglB family)
MAQKILVVDRNEAFAIMLKEMLEAEGEYEAWVADSGDLALNLLGQDGFDLTIVDMDLDPDQMDYRGLIHAVRQLAPTMRLVLIPLMGEDLPSEASQLDIQGTLSKPFFADDLLPRIQDALSKEVTASSPPPLEMDTSAPSLAIPSPPEVEPETPSRTALPPGPPSKEESSLDVQAVLADLSRETRADAILLLSTATDGERVLAHIAATDRLDVSELADLCIALVQTAQATSQVLGQPGEPFDHNMFESTSLRLYLMRLPDDRLLVVVGPTSTPLGTVRHNLRRAGRNLSVSTFT